MKKNWFVFLLGALAAMALLFGACGNVLDGTDEQQLLDKGYAKIRIELVGEDQQSIARTTLPTLNGSTVTYEYWFAKGSDPETKKTPVNNEFLLEPGSWKVKVKVIVSASTVAEGTSSTFKIPGPVTTIPVKLTPQGSGTGTLKVNISYPLGGATCTVSIAAYTAGSLGALSTLAGDTNNNGTYQKSDATRAAGSYLVTVVIKKGTKSAGTIQAVHIYQDLTTIWETSFSESDLQDAIPIKGVTLTGVLPPRQDVAAATLEAEVKNDTDLYKSFYTKAPAYKKDSDGSAAGTFTANTAYNLVITLTAIDGYTFAGLDVADVTINGTPLTTGLGAAPGTTAVITIPFATTDIPAVDSITVTTQPTLTYNYKDVLDLDALVVTLNYDTTPPSNSGAIPFADFGKWAIATTLEGGGTVDNTTSMVIATHNTKKIVITSNTKTAETDALVVNKKSLTGAVIEFSGGPWYFTGTAITPTVASVKVINNKSEEITLTVTTDYDTPVGSNHTDAASESDANPPTVTINAAAAGSYVGSAAKKFDIGPKTPVVDDLVIEFVGNEPLGYLKYDGTAKVPAVSPGIIKAGSTSLVAGTDFVTLSAPVYTDNINVGTGKATVTITGGNYHGSSGSADIVITKGDLTAALFTANPLSATYDGSDKTVNVTANSATITAGIGAITVKYGGSATPVPKDVSSTDITIDVAAGSNYNSATALAVGTLVINKADLDRYVFAADPAPIPFDGDPHAITTPLALASGKSGVGAPSNIRYNGSTTVPTNVGTYAVTANFGIGTNYNAGTGVSVATLTITAGVPAASDFNISGLTPTYDGTAKRVTITPKAGVGAVSNIRYSGSTAAPTDASTYPVLFDAAAGTNYDAKANINAGNLVIAMRTLVKNDFDITGFPTAAVATVPTINVTVKSPLTAPTYVLKYREIYGSDPADATPPQEDGSEDGTYEVTITITPTTNYNATTIILGQFDLVATP